MIDISDLKTKNTLIQFVRYFFVGGFCAVVDIAVFALFNVGLSVYYPLAVFLSFTAGTLTNFVLSNRFVFNRQSLSLSQACFRHYLSSIGGLITNELVMVLMIEGLGFERLVLVKIVATGCAFFVNFTLIKFYAFNHKFNLRQASVGVEEDDVI
ncbi:GtrA family protein [Patescibacteria group bacterium]|nr:GtrA family protein [Patescibacteria group bacterium]